jgi:hypothetical protein
MNKTASLTAAILLAGAAIVSGAAIAAGPGGTADPTTVRVEATDDIFAAGLTSGKLTTDQGTLPRSIAVKPGQKLMLTATGNALCCGTGKSSVDADGFAHNPFGSGSHLANPFKTRVASFNDRDGAFALVGVFNGPTLAAHTPFKIGASKLVTVPRGATKLYFGYADGYGFSGDAAAYSDNSGEITVTVTPQS